MSDKVTVNNEHTNVVMNAVLEEIEEAGKRIFESELSNPVLGRLPENIFRDYFLPRFSGDVVEERSKWVAEWIGIAGSPMAEVSIFNPSTAEELFTVPALLQTQGLLLEGGGGNLSNIFTRYQQLSNNIPQQGTRFLFEALSSKGEESKDMVDKTEVEERWLQIGARYNLIEKKEEEEEVETPDSVESDPEDLFEFN